jgi:hypothetical protein
MSGKKRIFNNKDSSADDSLQLGNFKDLTGVGVSQSAQSSRKGRKEILSELGDYFARFAILLR